MSCWPLWFAIDQLVLQNNIILYFHIIRDRKHNLILEVKELCRLDTSIEIDFGFLLNSLDIVTLDYKGKCWINSNKDLWIKQQKAYNNSALIHDDPIHDSITNAGHNYVCFSQTLYNWTDRHKPLISFEESA